MKIVQRVKDTMIAFRLRDDDARAFKARCALEKTSIQKVLESAVEEFMKGATKNPE